MLVRLLCAFTFSVASSVASAQVAGVPPGSPTTQAPAPPPATAAKPKRQPPHPLDTEAQGGGPDKVWVNLPSGSYHCPGDRYYGRTAHGRYMTEAAAKSAGAHGPRGKDCPKPK